MKGVVDYQIKEKGEVLLCDIIGPISSSLGGKKYILNMIDGYDDEYHLELLKTKDESNGEIKAKVNQLQTQTNKKLKRFHCDNAGEFVSEDLKNFFKENGTTLTTSEVYTPQHNGKAERCGRTVLEMIKSILYHCGDPMY